MMLLLVSNRRELSPYINCLSTVPTRKALLSITRIHFDSFFESTIFCAHLRIHSRSHYEVTVTSSYRLCPLTAQLYSAVAPRRTRKRAQQPPTHLPVAVRCHLCNGTEPWLGRRCAGRGIARTRARARRGGAAGAGDGRGWPGGDVHLAGRLLS
eukprot:COSAG02_NODE_42_length_46522_cov_109.704478_27_plen_154_part_00